MPSFSLKAGIQNGGGITKSASGTRANVWIPGCAENGASQK